MNEQEPKPFDPTEFQPILEELVLNVFEIWPGAMTKVLYRRDSRTFGIYVETRNGLMFGPFIQSGPGFEDERNQGKSASVRQRLEEWRDKLPSDIFDI